MEYNKNQFQKINDKKLLHKVGKQWVVISAFMLFAIGGSIAGIMPHAHAQSNTKTLSNNINHVNNKPNYSQIQPKSTDSVQKQANHLHQSILSNQAQSHKFQSNSTHQVNTVKSLPITQNKSNYVNNINHQFKNANNGSQNINTYVSSINQKFNSNKSTPRITTHKSEHINMPNIKDEINNNSDINSDTFNKYFNGSYRTGNFNGMNYKFYTQNRAMEFTNGYAVPYMSWFNTGDAAQAKYIRFDKGTNFSNVKSMSHIFDNTYTISIDFSHASGLNSGNLQSMDAMFYGNTVSPLKYINIGNLNTSNVQDESGVFGTDPNLIKIDGLQNFSTKSANDMEQMFAGDHNLRSLDLSNFDTTAARNNNNTGKGAGYSDGLSSMIGSDENLRTITLGENTKLTNKAINGDITKSYAIGNGMNGTQAGVPFQLADGQSHPGTFKLLQGINASGHWGSAEWIMDSNNDLWLLGSGTNNDMNANGGKITTDKGTYNRNAITNIYTNNVIAPTSSFKNGTDIFSNLPNVKYIDFSGMDTSKTNYLGNLFKNDYKLQGVNLHGLDVRNVGDIGEMFQSDKSLEYVDLSNLNFQNCNNLGEMFWNDPNLIAVNMNNLRIPNSCQWDQVFQSDTNLKYLDFRKVYAPNSFNFFNMFDNDNNLSIIMLGNPNNFKLNGTNMALSGNWVNQNGQSVNSSNMVNQGTYYRFSDCINGTINYQFGNQIVHQYKGIIPKEFNATTAPGLPSGYAINPQNTTIYQMSPNSTQNIQVDKAGEWGTADWYLDNQGNMLVADGQTSFVPGGLSGFINNGKGITGPLNPNDIITISTSNLYPPANNLNTISNPSVSSGYYWSAAYNTWSNLPNVRDIDLRGVHYENCNDLTDMFYGDVKLSDLNMSNVDDTKAINNKITGGSQSWGSNGNGINGIFSRVLPKKLELGPNTILTGNVDLFNQGNRVIFGSLANNPGDLTVLDDGKSHPGIWNVTYGDIGKWGSATWGFDARTNTLHIANGQITDNRADANSLNWSNVKHIDTYNVTAPTDMSNLFSVNQGGTDISNLQTANLSGMDTTNTTNMGSLFQNDKHVTDINLNGNKFNTSKLTSMNAMFDDVSDLRSITFGPNFNTSNVSDFNYMFISDRNLDTLNLSHFDTRKAARNNNGGLNSGNGLGSMLSSSDTGSKPNQESVPDHILILGSNTILGADGQGQTNIPSTHYYINKNNSDILSASDNKPSDTKFKVIADGKAHPGVWYTNNGLANVTLKYGKSTLGKRNIPLFNNQAHSAEFKFSQNGINYELDPRVQQTISMNNNGNYTVQLDMTGKWNNATWDLTPDSDDGNNSATKKYGYGNLYIHDGLLNGIGGGPYGNLHTELGINNYNISKQVESISTHNVIAPTDCSRLFDDEPQGGTGLPNSQWFPNLTNIDVSGLDTSHVTDMFAMFGGLRSVQHITGLTHFNTSNVTGNKGSGPFGFNSMFCTEPNLRSIDISSINTKNGTLSDGAMFQAYGPSTLHQITLGSNAIFDNNANLPYNTGYNTQNHNDIENLEDGKAHPGTWVIPAKVNDTFQYHNIYNGQTINLTNPNNIVSSDLYNLPKSVPTPNGWTIVDNSGNPINPTVTADGNTHTYNVAPIYAGLTYKFYNSPQGKVVEFEKGQLNWQGDNNDNSCTNSFIGGRNRFNVPNELDNANVIKFDSDVDVSKVTQMDNMIAWDYNVHEIDLGSNFKTSQVTDMNRMFNSDLNLQKITGLDNPNFNTSNVNDMSYMFYSDSDLQSLNLGPNFDTSRARNNMGGILDTNRYNKSNLRTINIQSPKTVFANNVSFFHNWYQINNANNYNPGSNSTVENGYVAPINKQQIDNQQSHVGIWTNQTPYVDEHINYQWMNRSVGSADIIGKYGSDYTLSRQGLPSYWNPDYGSYGSIGYDGRFTFGNGSYTNNEYNLTAGVATEWANDTIKYILPNTNFSDVDGFHIQGGTGNDSNGGGQLNDPRLDNPSKYLIYYEADDAVHSHSDYNYPLLFLGWDLANNAVQTNRGNNNIIPGTHETVNKFVTSLPASGYPSDNVSSQSSQKAILEKVAQDIVNSVNSKISSSKIVGQGTVSGSNYQEDNTPTYFTIPKDTKSGLPKGYHLINANDYSFNYDNGTHYVDVAPNQIILHYVNKNGQNRNTNIYGQSDNKVIDTTGCDTNNYTLHPSDTPSNYALINQSSVIPINVSNKSTVNINVTPNKVNETIIFKDGNNTISSTTKNGYYGYTSDVSIPNNYYYSNNQLKAPFTYKNGTSIINVAQDTDKITFHDIYGNSDKMTLPSSITESGRPNDTYTVSAPKGWAFVNNDGSLINNNSVKNSNSLTYKYNQGNQYLDIAPVYKGFTYKYDKANNSVEFVNGTADSDLSSFITQANSNIRNATSIKFDSNIDISKVSAMNSMFENESNLQSLDLGNNFNTSNVSRMGCMFESDKKLQSINFGNNFYTGNVFDMISMFENDSDLQSMNLGNNFNTSNVSEMSNMFSSDFKLESLNLGNSFDTHKAFNAVSGMNNMFRFDNSFNSLTIQSNKTKFNSSAGLPTMYKKLNNVNYGVVTPNDFSKGNTGTFVRNPAKLTVNYINQNNQVVGTTQSDIQVSNNSITWPVATKDIPHGYTLDKGQPRVTNVNNDNANSLSTSVHNIYVTGNKTVLHIKFYDETNNKNLDSDEFNMNGTNAIGDTMYDIGIPSGYHVDTTKFHKSDSILKDDALSYENNQSLDYTFNPSNIASDKTITINGNPQTVEDMNNVSVPLSADNATVNIKYIDSDGNNISGHNYQINDQIGKSDTLNNIPRNYALDNSNENRYVFSASNIKTHHYNDDLMNDYNVYVHKSNQMGTLRVVYLNQNNDPVGKIGVIRGAISDKVNITNTNIGGEPIPKDYALNSDEDVNNFITSNDSTIYLKVHGLNITTNVNVIRILENNGKISTSSASDSVSGNNGDIAIVHANDKGLIPNEYQVDNNHSTFKPILVDADNKPTVIFYYKANQQVGAPITVNYINHGRLVKQTNISDGIIGDNEVKDTPISSIINSNIPTNYKLTEPVDTYRFSKYNQSIDLNVIGNPIDSNFIVHRVLINGSDMSTSNVPITLHSRIGSDITIDPYLTNNSNYNINTANHSLIPSDYHPGRNSSLLLRINDNGVIKPLNKISYVYYKNYQPTSIKKIRIHYLNTSNNSEVDEESDQGTVNDSFEIKPYTENIPEIPDTNYTIDDSTTYDKSGNKINCPTSFNFKGNTYDVYLHVKSNGNNLIVLPNN